MNKLTGKEIIELILEELNIKAPTFASNIGVDYQRIYDIQRERTKNISATVANSIYAEYPQFNIGWIMSGSGEMLINSGRDNNIIGGDNSGVVGNSGVIGNIGGHNVSIAGDSKAKKIIDKDRIEIELEQSAELYQQKIDSLEQRVKDLEALVQAKEEIIQMFKNK